MINYPVNNFKNSPYKNFIDIKNDQRLETVETPPLSAVKVGDVDSQKPINNKKIFGIIGLSVGSAALLTLVALFTLSKGFSAGFAKRITKLSDRIKTTIYDLSNETKKLTWGQKFKLRFSKAMQPIADSMQASSNITAIKDSLFHKLLKKFHLETAIQKTNKFFKNNIVLKTKNQAYQSAELATIDFCGYLKKMAQEKGQPELAQKAQQILDSYTKTFSATAHVERADVAWQKMAGLDEKVFDKLFRSKIGFFKNLKQFKSYITTDMIAKDKNVIQKNLITAKTNISNDLNDVYLNIKAALKDLKTEINPKNEKAVKLLKELILDLENSKNLKGVKELGLRKEMLGKVKANLQELSSIMVIDTKNPSKTAQINEKIVALLDSLSESMTKKGIAQEAITLLKEDTAQYKVAKKLANKMNLKLNEAITSELNTYDKLAELQVGSVPTDILGILGPSALATGLIIASDTKNEKISTTFTKGIPILGGIGVSYYGMTRGFTGVKNLVLGLATGGLLNVIGTKVDEVYKKYIEKQTMLKKTFDAFTKLQAKNET